MIAVWGRDSRRFQGEKALRNPRSLKGTYHEAKYWEALAVAHKAF